MTFIEYELQVVKRIYSVDFFQQIEFYILIEPFFLEESSIAKTYKHIILRIVWAVTNLFDALYAVVRNTFCVLDTVLFEYIPVCSLMFTMGSASEGSERLLEKKNI